MSYNSICVETTGGTGFFYKNTRSDRYWLITNRHILFPIEPDKVESSEYPYSNKMMDWCDIHFYNMRKPYVLEKTLPNRIRYHSNPEVDIIAININELFYKSKNDNKEIDVYNYYKCWNNIFVFNDSNIPTQKPEIDNEVIFMGFPRKKNGSTTKIPVMIKAKIVSDYYGNTDGLPYFLINKHFPVGGSGSPVFLQKNFTLSDKGKSLILIGILAGINNSDKNGVVYRSDFIDEIVDMEK